MHKGDQEKSAQETSEESQSGTHGQVQFGSGKEESTKLAVRCQSCTSTGISRMTEKNAKKNCKGTVRRCTLIRMRQEKSKKNELNTPKQKSDSQFTADRRTAEITADLVLQTSAKMSVNKVNGP